MGSIRLKWGSRLWCFSAAIVVELQSFTRNRERVVGDMIGFELCSLNCSVGF